jgi:hypothetical protein
MNELFPIGIGIILGLVFAARFRVLRPFWIKAVLVLIPGAASTILSGEYHDSWGFVLVDIGEVALAAWIVAYICGKVRERLAPSGSRKSTG